MSAVVNLKDVLFGDGKTYRVIAFYQGEVVLFRMDKRGFQGSSSKPPSLIDGEANLFKLGAFDRGLKSVESSRER